MILDILIGGCKLILKFFENEYIPASFEEVGCWQRPNGKAMYADLAKRFTTTDLSPQQIHDIGQSEVKRIRAEMEEIQRLEKLSLQPSNRCWRRWTEEVKLFSLQQMKFWRWSRLKKRLTIQFQAQTPL